MNFELILPFLRPIEALLVDEDVSEIMGNPNSLWFCERDGELCQEPNISFDPGRLRTGLEVIANQLDKRLEVRPSELAHQNRLATTGGGRLEHSQSWTANPVGRF